MAKAIYTLPAGFECGPFTVIAEAGRGGIAIVYRAAGPEGKQYAIKTMQFTRSLQLDQVKRFMREIHIVANINHLNVVHFYDAGRIERDDAGSILWMAQEFIDGVTLRDMLHKSGGRVSVDDVASWSEQIAGGVAAAHQAGIVHRDLKPENVMLIGAGNTKIIKVIDFNISKFRKWGTTTTNHKRPALGTVGYMAPEQVDGDSKDIDERVDVYGLGLLIFELATGKHALAPDGQQLSMEETLARTCAYTPPRLDVHIRGFPAELATIAERALKKKPRDRFPTMAAMREALNKFHTAYLTTRRQAVLQGTDWGDLEIPDNSDASGGEGTAKLAGRAADLQHADQTKDAVTAITAVPAAGSEDRAPQPRAATRAVDPTITDNTATTRSGGRLALTLNRALDDRSRQSWALRGVGGVLGGAAGYLSSGLLFTLLSPLWAAAPPGPHSAARPAADPPSVSAQAPAPSASTAPSTPTELEPEPTSAVDAPVPSATAAKDSQPRWQPTPPTRPSKPDPASLFPDLK